MRDVNGELLGSKEMEKLQKNRGSIEKLASGRDGQSVIGMLAETGVEESLKKGDVASVKSAIENAMRTDEGKRFLAELSKLMNK